MTDNNQAVEAAPKLSDFDCWFMLQSKMHLATPETIAYNAWYASRAAITERPVAEVAQGVVTDARRDEVMRHDYPVLQQFHSKHAFGALAAPSCLCCGKSTQGVEIGVQHMELPAIVICKPCKDAASRAPVAVGVEPVAWAVYLVSGQALEQKSVFFGRGNAEELACTIKGVTEIRPLYATQPAGAGVSVGREQDEDYQQQNDELIRLGRSAGK